MTFRYEFIELPPPGWGIKGINGSIITAVRDGAIKTRNSSHFKRSQLMVKVYYYYDVLSAETNDDAENTENAVDDTWNKSKTLCNLGHLCLIELQGMNSKWLSTSRNGLKYEDCLGTYVVK